MQSFLDIWGNKTLIFERKADRFSYADRKIAICTLRNPCLRDKISVFLYYFYRKDVL